MATREEELRRRLARTPNDPNRPRRDPAFDLIRAGVEAVTPRSRSVSEVEKVNRRIAAQNRASTLPPPTDPNAARGFQPKQERFLPGREPAVNPRGVGQRRRNPAFVEPVIRNPRGLEPPVAPDQPEQSPTEAVPLGNRVPSSAAENVFQPPVVGEEEEEEEELALPANVGDAARQIVRPPPREPEGIEVIRGTDRKFQQIDAEGSTRNQAEFSLLPGRTVAESREAAAFGDPNFIAQQESRRGDVQAQAQANQGTASLVNAVSNSGQLGINEDGTLNYNVIDPTTGQYKQVPISPWVAEAIPDPQSFKLEVIDQLGVPVLMMVNESDGTERVVSTKNDQQVAITAKFVTLAEALREAEDDDPVENALKEIEDEYGSIFTDFSFLSRQ